VKVELVDAAMQEIWHELEALREECIPVHELETVQNYLLGSFMGSLNTAFDIGDKYKMLYTQGLTRAYYDQYVENVRAVKRADVQRVAQAYWQKEALSVVIVGGAIR
jgi:zinc protease